MAGKQCLSTSGTWLANNICLIQETFLGNDVSWFDHFQETLKENNVLSDSWLHYFPPNINSIKQQNKQHDTTNMNNFRFFQVEIRPMMYLALTYDHRLIDGREAVTFLRKIKSTVEDPRTILLDL